MKVWVSPYELKYRELSSQKGRKGFLIKVQSSDFEYGYGDYFPWPEFGDSEIEKALKELESGRHSTLLSKSLSFAIKDGEARAIRKSLTLGVEKLRNHKLITHVENCEESFINSSIEQGFSSFKIKVGNDQDKELSVLKLFEGKPCKVRLDFNGKMTNDWISHLLDYAHFIEFIEDPFNEACDWEHLQNLTGISLAYDQASLDEKDAGAELKIIKPAKQRHKKTMGEDVVFTSYLDHPVGIAHACVEALEYGEQKRDYGLMSYEVYDLDSSHHGIKSLGNKFWFSEGYGIGFDHLWKELSWVFVK